MIDAGDFAVLLGAAVFLWLPAVFVLPNLDPAWPGWLKIAAVLATPLYIPLIALVACAILPYVIVRQTLDDFRRWQESRRRV